jgi:hypothetical protein
MQITKEEDRVYYLRTNLPSCLYVTLVMPKKENIKRQHRKLK